MRKYCKYWVVFTLVLLLLFTLSGCKVYNRVIGGEPVEGETPEENVNENDGAEDSQEAGEEQQAQEDIIRKDIQLMVTGDNLALRNSPGTQNKQAEDILARLKRDQAVFLQNKYDNQVEIDGYVWWEVYDPLSELKGWCAAKYLGSSSTETPGQGTIEGSITFPAEDLPDGFTVVAEEVATGREFATDQIIYDSKYRFGVGFIINVPPGNYYLYAFEPDAADFKAYYDEHMQSDFEINSYEKIVVPVMEGQQFADVLVGNWWREDYP